MVTRFRRIRPIVLALTLALGCIAAPQALAAQSDMAQSDSAPAPGASDADSAPATPPTAAVPPAAAAPAPPRPAKQWRVGLAEQGALLVSQTGGLYFSQYYNDVAVEFDRVLARPFWIGFSTGYVGALPSQISETTPLVMPGWDSFHSDVHVLLMSDQGWQARLGVDAWYSKIGNVQLYAFYLGADLALAKQFDLGGVVLEPGLASSWQFRRDVGTTWAVGLRLRVLL